MKDRKKRKIIIGFLAVLLVFMTIGYSILSTTLNITSTSNFAGEWKVVIDSIDPIDNDTEAVNKNVIIASDGLSAEISNELKKPGDYIEYLVTIKNSGMIKAFLNNVVITPVKGPYNGITASSYEDNVIINEKETYSFKIKIEFPLDNNITSIDNNETKYKFSINLNQYSSSSYSISDIESGQFFAVDSSNKAISINVPNNSNNRNKAQSDGITYNSLDSFIVIPKSKNIKGYILSDSNNVKVIDEFGNTMYVPEGYFIKEESLNVPSGVIIEDSKNIVGNQFVWVPVGMVYSNNSTKIVKAGRYKFSKGSGDHDTKSYNPGDIVEGLTVRDYNEGFKTTLDTSSTYYNVYHYEKDIYNNNDFIKSTNLFKNSVNNFNGFYFARYEARKNGNTIVNNNNYPVYNFISQVDSFNKSNIDKTNYSIALSNSTAWDTTTLFVQLFDDRIDKSTPYSRVKGGLINTSLSNYGTSDVICNIYDMSGNVTEWVASTNTIENDSSSTRGGYFGTDSYTNSYLQFGDNPSGYNYIGFRQMLLLK